MSGHFKAFWEEHTSTLFKTLKLAKTAHKHPYIYRVWLNSRLEIVGKEPVWCYGTQVTTIKRADAIIEERLNSQEQEGGAS